MSETRSAALDRVNEAFHTAYDAMKTEAQLDAPVLVVLGDVLVLVDGGARREMPLTPPMFHVVKSVAHAPVGLHAVLARHADAAAMDDDARGALEEMRGRFARGTEEADAASADMRIVLSRCLALAEDVLRTRRIARADLDAFARDLGPVLLRLTDDATRLQLEALHACVEEITSALDAKRRAVLEVVVVGAHQARARSYAMQYFQKRLGEKEGVEDRVAYAESVETVEEALALVGTRRLDRAIARAFFGDAKRLQRDVLGDAAAACLRRMKLPPL